MASSLGFQVQGLGLSVSSLLGLDIYGPEFGVYGSVAYNGNRAETRMEN